MPVLSSGFFKHRFSATESSSEPRLERGMAYVVFTLLHALFEEAL